MSISPRSALRAVAAAAAVLSAFATPLAQADTGAYPNKPIRLVVPYAAGGSTDIIGRLLAQKMGENMGVSVVVDNKPGANGTIGCDYVAKQPADGYTIILGDVGCMAMAPGLYTKLPYNPLKDFSVVSLVGRSPLVLTVGSKSPLTSVADLTAAAKANPGKLNFPSSGTGGPNHLGAELYAMQAKVKVTHVPYKGSAPSVVSLVAGETDFGFLTAVTINSQLNAGNVKALAVAHTERLSGMPNVPTFIEQGLKGFTADAWFMASVPVGTPQPVVDRLYKEIAKALPDAEVKAKFDSAGVLPSGLDPKASTAFLNDEVNKWRNVIKTANITLD
ncbi:Bug family tripartite tricarboxylate transporter substrate binding protein [Diaphorobacter caeni]|uniref:Bug family tripartite tricarboxylate transporter substrate binding protein n=1 Tax=Diaphorobacter caeni TaxID=2784387 RepID=UPI00188EB3B5|nr:tripartite tricarboxylate transporter substrate binding protein [Diaphorobacter caeni]MBF5004997.1 tripartite tricarboxylate transporter substrate binding protein [Diaphorobacter caeni]